MNLLPLIALGTSDADLTVKLIGDSSLLDYAVNGAFVILGGVLSALSGMLVQWWEDKNVNRQRICEHRETVYNIMINFTQSMLIRTLTPECRQQYLVEINEYYRSSKCKIYASESVKASFKKYIDSVYGYLLLKESPAGASMIGKLTEKNQEVTNASDELLLRIKGELGIND